MSFNDYICNVNYHSQIVINNKQRTNIQQNQLKNNKYGKKR